MEKINPLLLLKPKAELSSLSEDMSVRQAIEKMRVHSYMATPVISKNGEYLGSITEGDLLWTLVDEDSDLEALEDINIREIIRKDYMPAVKVDADTDMLISMITEQNYVPIVDDRNILMGIVTRKKVIETLTRNEE